MNKLFNQNGIVHILPLFIIVTAVGIISYLLIASSAPFQSGIFKSLFTRPFSHAATAQLMIFDDAFRNGFNTNDFQNPSGTKCTVGPNTTLFASGSASLAVNLNSFCTSNIYTPTTFNVDSYTDLEFDIYGKAPVDSTFHVSIMDTNYSSVGSDVMISNYVTPNQTWQHVKIPLSTFNISPGTDIDGVSFQDDTNVTGTGNLLFDNLQFSALPDTTPPTVIGVKNTDLTHLVVSFSEKVATAEAQTAANYSISSSNDTNYSSGKNPSSANLSLNGTDVTLTLPQSAKNNTAYTLNVNTIHDLAGNQIAPNTAKNFIAVLQTATLTVNAANNIYPFNKLMRGAGMATWMHAANKKPYPGDIPQLVELAKQMKVGIVRFAGGNWANDVIWDRTNTIDEWSTSHRIYNAAMMDSLAKFKQATGTEVLVQVNVCWNNPAMWADMLKYANVEHNYGFKYWEIGSENNYDTCADNTDNGNKALTPTELASRYVAYRKALLAVDSTIIAISPASAGFTGEPSAVGSTTDWLKPLVDSAVASGKPLDGLVLHWYQSNEGYGTSGCDGEIGPIVPLIFNYNTALFNCNYPAGSVIGTPGNNDEDYYLAHRRIYPEIMANWLKTIYLKNSPNTLKGLTEINTLAGSGTNPMEGNHIAAIWFADMLGRMAYAGYDLNTLYDLYDGTDYGLLNPKNELDPNTIISIRPTYYTMLMYAKYFGDQMVESRTSDSKQLVTVWATKDTQDPGKLKLMVTNLSDSSVNATLNLSGFTPKSGTYYELSSSQPLDMRGISAEDSGSTTINGAKIDTTSVASITSSINGIPLKDLGSVSTSFTHAFPAYSATSIILDNGGTPTPSSTPTDSPASTPSTKVGDINGDGKVDIFDYNLLIGNFNKSGTGILGDLDINGVVNIFDYNILVGNFGK